MRKSGALSMLDCGRRSPIPMVFRCEVDMKLRLFCAGVFGIVALVSASVSAQWPLYPATDAPRTSSGRVRLDAPTPRTPDGKPDLSGLWQTIRTGSGQVIVGTELPPLLRTSQFWNIGAGLDGDLPLQPWAYELRNKRIADHSKDNPDAHCLPIGLTQLHNHPQPRKMIQTPSVLLILYEANGRDPSDLHGRQAVAEQRPAAVVVRLLDRQVGRRHARC